MALRGLFGKSDAVEVVPGLYIGSAPDRRSSIALARAGITHVIDLRADAHAAPSHWPEKVSVERWGLIEYTAPSPETLEAVARRVASLLQARGGVLLHCREGIQRAPMVACAALIETGWSLRDAYRLVSARRPATALSEAQLRVLRAVEENNVGRSGRKRTEIA